MGFHSGTAGGKGEATGATAGRREGEGDEGEGEDYDDDEQEEEEEEENELASGSERRHQPERESHKSKTGRSRTASSSDPAGTPDRSPAAAPSASAVDWAAGIVVCHSEPGAWSPSLFQTAACPPAGYEAAAHVIGRTMFETDRVTEEHVRRCNRMDEVSAWGGGE